MTSEAGLRRLIKTIQRQHAITLRKLDNIERQLGEIAEEEPEVLDGQYFPLKEPPPVKRPWWKRWRNAA